MQYALFIHTDENAEATWSPEHRDEVMDGYRRFREHLEAKGALVLGRPLHPTSTATTVRVRNGTAVPTDGPFAETKEQLGGLFVIEAATEAEAIAFAAMIPDASDGRIEVRPIRVNAV